MFRRLVTLQLCAVLKEAQAAGQQVEAASGDTRCSNGTCHVEVDAALLLQHHENHWSGNALRNSTGNEQRQETEAVQNLDNATNITMQKLAGQMARQMAWEFQNTKGQLLKLAGPATISQLTQNQTSVSGQEVSLFVRAAYKAVPIVGVPQGAAVGEAKVQVELEMAAPDQILWVYGILWMPLTIAWLWSGWTILGLSQELSHSQSLELRQLLQLSVGALTISAVISNQSLCILTRAPMALTLFQSAVSVCIGAILWGCQIWLRPMQHPTARQICAGLWQWMPCAACFACFQVADHFVSNYTSISERVILGNLVPVFAWMAEMTFPETFQASDQGASISAKAALFSTVCGAVFFVTQDAALTPLGISSCALCSLVLLIYRLFQRGVLVTLLACPVTCLLTFDSLISCVISYFLCGPADLTALRDWSIWIETPQVFALLVLSGIGMGIGHLVVILCLRSSSATLTLVICNVASMICLIQGMIFFNDSQFQHPLAVVGMAVNVIGGVWYTMSQVGIGMVEMVHSDSKAAFTSEVRKDTQAEDKMTS